MVHTRFHELPALNALPLLFSLIAKDQAGDKATVEAVLSDTAALSAKDQQVGNAGGLFLRSWFISNPTGKLSDAYRAWFASSKEKC